MKHARYIVSKPSPSKYILTIDEWLQYEQNAINSYVPVNEYHLNIHRYKTVLVQLQQSHIPHWKPGQFTSIYSSLKPILQSDEELFCLKYFQSCTCPCGAITNRNTTELQLLLSESDLQSHHSMQVTIDDYVTQLNNLYCDVYVTVLIY